jgi:hypothetical protein
MKKDKLIEAAQDAFWAIANMQVENENEELASEALELCKSIARLELERYALRKYL